MHRVRGEEERGDACSINVPQQEPRQPQNNQRVQGVRDDVHEMVGRRPSLRQPVRQQKRYVADRPVRPPRRAAAAQPVLGVEDAERCGEPLPAELRRRLENVVVVPHERIVQRPAAARGGQQQCEDDNPRQIKEMLACHGPSVSKAVRCVNEPRDEPPRPAYETKSGSGEQSPEPLPLRKLRAHLTAMLWPGRRPRLHRLPNHTSARSETIVR